MEIPKSAGKVSLDSLSHIRAEPLTPQTRYSTDEALLYHENIEGHRIDYLWRPNLEHRRLFVLFSGNAMRSRNDPPVFQRWSWASHFPGSCLYVSDPTLYLSRDIGLAWYSGTAKFDPLPFVAQRILDIAAQIGIARENIFSYGSSGGGFAALRLAAITEGIGAISVNPQIQIRHYEMLGSTDRYTRTCFGNIDRIEASLRYPDRFDMLAHVDALRQRRVIYIQNTSDTHHFNIHYTPFCASMGTSTDANTTEGLFRRLLFDDPGGHAKAETPEVFKVTMDIVTREFAPA